MVIALVIIACVIVYPLIGLVVLAMARAYTKHGKTVSIFWEDVPHEELCHSDNFYFWFVSASWPLIIITSVLSALLKWPIQILGRRSFIQWYNDKTC